MPNDDTIKHTQVGRRTAWQRGCLVVLLAVLFACGAAGAPPKQVLLLQSFGREFASFDAFSETFRTELGQQLGDQVRFPFEVLDQLQAR